MPTPAPSASSSSSSCGGGGGGAGAASSYSSSPDDRMLRGECGRRHPFASSAAVGAGSPDAMDTDSAEPSSAATSVADFGARSPFSPGAASPANMDDAGAASASAG